METLIDQSGQVAAMIDVGMAQNDGINFMRMKGKAAVTAARLFARSAVHAAIQKDAMPAGFDEMHRTGHRLGGAPKSDLRQRGTFGNSH
jgi:hypothetical protein